MSCYDAWQYKSQDQRLGRPCVSHTQKIMCVWTALHTGTADWRTDWWHHLKAKLFHRDYVFMNLFIHWSLKKKSIWFHGLWRWSVIIIIYNEHFIYSMYKKYKMLIIYNNDRSYNKTQIIIINYSCLEVQVKKCE